jgi:flagellar biosynthetic protein FliR
MFSVTYAQLNVWLTSFLWPFVRILALIGTAPLFSQAAIPTTAKIGLAAFITLIVAPTLGAVPQATAFSAAGILIMINQFMIGAALGVTMQVAFAAIDAAGTFIGTQMGLSFATLYDPREDGNSVVVSSFLNTIAMLAFVVVDGHLQMIGALVSSFQSVPLSANVLGDAVHARGWQTIAVYGASVLSTGLLLALPVIAALLIADLSLGILNRVAPQIGIFQVGFPLTMLVGLLLILLMMPNMMMFFQGIFDRGIDAMGRVAGAL